MQYNGFFKLFYDRFSLGFVRFFEIARYLQHPFSIGDGYEYLFKAVALRFVHLFNGGISRALNAIGLALEIAHGKLECALFEVGCRGVDKLFFAKRTLHGKYLEEVFFATFVIVSLDDVDNTVPNGVGDVHSDAFAQQGVASFLVNHGTLLVHHVVVFQQVLTNTEVVFLYLLLCTLNTLRNHWAFDAFALFKSKAVHDACDAF